MKIIKINYSHRAGASGGGTDDDDERDEAKEALAHLIAQLFLGVRQPVAASAQDLVAAAANNNETMVEQILRKKPDLVNCVKLAILSFSVYVSLQLDLNAKKPIKRRLQVNHAQLHYLLF